MDKDATLPLPLPFLALVHLERGEDTQAVEAAAEATWKARRDTRAVGGGPIHLPTPGRKARHRDGHGRPRVSDWGTVPCAG
jgi:hypothetical protein